MRFKGIKCVVTGGSGFIGTHLVNQLVKEGAIVRVVSTHLTDNNEPCSRVDFQECDITDFDKTKRALYGFDIVFNMAALPRIPWTVKDPLLSHDVNATGALNVFEASRQNGIKRVVHSSSCILYCPNTPYYVSKLCAEEYANIYNNLYEQSIVSLRYSTVYGVGQSTVGPHPNVLASFRHSKETNGKIWITGDGTQSRDFVHVSDVVEANLRAALSDYKGYLDICTGVNTPLIEVAKHFDCPIEHIPDVKGDQKHVYSDPEDAYKVLGWKAQVTFEKGIKDVIGAM